MPSEIPPKVIPPKPGLLVEDMNAIEVTDSTGRQRIEKTLDRDQRAADLREVRTGVRPTHPNMNG